MRNMIVMLLTSAASGGVSGRSQLLLAELSKHYNIQICYLHKSCSRPCYSFDRFHSYLKVLFLLRNAQLVISFSLLPNLFSVLFSRKSLICPTGSAWHDRDSSLISRLYWSLFLQPITYLLADAIVPASPILISRRLMRLLNIEKKIHPIYGFIPYSTLERRRRETQYHPSLSPGYFLFLGALTNHKGAYQALQIYYLATTMKKALPPLLFCGAGPLKNFLIEECSTLGLPTTHTLTPFPPTPSVAFLEFMPKPYETIALSKILIAPSYYEGLSNSILEGLYLSDCVLSTSHDSNNYIYSHLSSSCDPNRRLESRFILLPFPDSHIKLGIWAKALLDQYKQICSESFEAIPIYVEDFSVNHNLQSWLLLVENLIQSYK